MSESLIPSVINIETQYQRFPTKINSNNPPIRLLHLNRNINTLTRNLRPHRPIQREDISSPLLRVPLYLVQHSLHILPPTHQRSSPRRTPQLHITTLSPLPFPLFPFFLPFLPSSNPPLPRLTLHPAHPAAHLRTPAGKTYALRQKNTSNSLVLLHAAAAAAAEGGLTAVATVHETVELVAVEEGEGQGKHAGRTGGTGKPLRGKWHEKFGRGR